MKIIIIVYVVSLLAIISCRGHKKSKESFGDTPLPAIATNHNRTEVRYDLDTVLKNGYYLKFRIDSNKQSIFLVNWHEIAKIASTSLGLPFRMLGYKISDFPQQFVFGHSNGSGNPVDIELIDKKTGSNLIKQGSIFLDADETNELLLYAGDDFRVKKENIFLFDAKKNITRSIILPSTIRRHSGIVESIQIDTVFNWSIILSVTLEDSIFRLPIDR